MRRRPKLGSVAVTAGLILGAIVVLAPFLWMFSTSMRPAQQAYALPPSWIPTDLNPDNYLAALDGPVPLVRNAVNSLVIALATTAGVLVTSSMAGYAFAKLRFRFKGALFALLLAALMFPIQVTIVPLFTMMRSLDLINNPLSLILPSTFSALGVFLLRQLFTSVPDELIEAARIDGAREWTIFRRIALPLARPAMAALGIITFLLSWNSYFAPLVFLTRLETATLPLALVILLGPYRAGNPAIVMAATTMAIVPALLAFLFGQRWIVETLSRSGTKG
ncbi:carbohydrate ABC transporter permease [Nitriliruptor alkaliphilus]|uniref:carbohydrate ABC transporter permease n=1 Tax=Nitriliruptor alkaliphilus TaxID=427918 RepID=UPI000696C6EA|nr:carbohydrate ABC transporter permease [Nitriliruptor alkaliphilus]